jgi:hypothetical protein
MVGGMTEKKEENDLDEDLVSNKKEDRHKTLDNDENDDLPFKRRISKALIPSEQQTSNASVQ